MTRFEVLFSDEASDLCSHPRDLPARDHLAQPAHGKAPPPRQLAGDEGFQLGLRSWHFAGRWVGQECLRRTVARSIVRLDDRPRPNLIGLRTESLRYGLRSIRSVRPSNGNRNIPGPPGVAGRSCSG